MSSSHLTPIPDGWARMSFGEVGQLVKGISYSSNQYADSDMGVPFITIKCVSKSGGFKTEGIKYYKGPIRPYELIQTGDLLIANTDLTRAGDIVGCPVRLPDLGAPRVTMSMDLSKIQVDMTVADPGFIYHKLMERPARSFMRENASGSTVLHLKTSAVPRLLVQLPSDIYEQRQITQVLDTLDTAIYETEAIIAKLKAVKQGLLHDLLTRGIDANGELRPPQAEAPHLYKESLLGWIPKEWGLKPLGQILVEPTKNGLYKPIQFHGRGPLMVQMGGLFAGDAATFDTATRVQVTPFEFNTFGLSNGDLLFARRSLVFEGAGQCVIIRNLTEPATFESSIVRVRVKQDEAHPEFVFQFLRGHRSNAQRRTLIRQVAVSGVSGADIRELLIALPPLKEQGWVVGRQLEMQARIDLELATVAKLRSQKAGLMNDLLTGNVRVTPLLTSEEQLSPERSA